MFCCTLFCVLSSIAIILMGKRELVALLNLSSWCLVMVERLFLAVPRGCLWFVIVVFPDLSFFLSLLVRSYMSITPGSANLEILIKKKQKKKKTKKQTKKHKNFWLNFCLNKECPKLLCGLGICHRRRQTIPMWNSSGEKGILQGITVCLVSAVLSTMR